MIYGSFGGMTELALHPNGLWRADLKSRVVRSVYYDGESGLLAIELRHGKICLYSNAAEEAVLKLVNHPAPGLVYESATERSFGMRLSRFRPKGATFLCRVKRARALGSQTIPFGQIRKRAAIYTTIRKHTSEQIAG